MDSLEARIVVARLRRDRAADCGHDGEAQWYEAEVERLIARRALFAALAEDLATAPPDRIIRTR